MKALDPEAAKELPLFSGLQDDQVNRLLEAGTVKQYSAETVLFKAGERAAFLHVILRGMVEIFGGRPPRESTLFLMASGDIFMPAATLFGEPYLNSARTLMSSRILLLPAEAAQSEFLRSHQMAINVSRALAGHFRMAARYIIDLRSCSAPERLARFLLRFVDEVGTAGTVRLPVAKGKLAARVGMTPETFSRALQTLAGNGLLVRGSQVIVRDRARIEEFCRSARSVPAGKSAFDVRAL